MKAILYTASFSLLLVTTLVAKRAAPKEVPSITTDKAIFSVPHFPEGERSHVGGVIEAHHPETKELLWRVILYRTDYDETLEGDVQDVFIQTLSFDKTHNLLIAIVSSWFCISAEAAIPLDTERQLQEESPEKLKIEIVKITSAEKGGWYHLTVRAKVISVEETKSGLKKGAVVEVSYTYPDLDKIEVAGAWASPVKEGVKYSAFLKQKGTEGKNCEPAALSGSFERIEKS